MATTLATGQFLASALMYWFFRFWHRQFRIELASEQGRLLDRARPEPAMARLLATGGSEVLVEVGRLRPGDRVIVAAGETGPADGPILFGEGVVDERGVRGLEGISRKRAGDRLLAGSTVLAGSLQVEVSPAGRGDAGLGDPPGPGRRDQPRPRPNGPDDPVGAVRVPGRRADPGDGRGWLPGRRPPDCRGDPSPRLRDRPRPRRPPGDPPQRRPSPRLGIVVRDPEALERLAEVDLMVLDDHQALSRIELEVTRVETRLPESIVLRYAASAFRHLVDDRATALLPPAGRGGSTCSTSTRSTSAGA